MFLNSLKHLFFAALAGVCILQAKAQAPYYNYVSTQDGMIYKVNLSNCTIEPVIYLVNKAYDIALSPSGKLYVLNDLNDIYVLDLSTYSYAAVGNVGGAGQVNSLVCDSVGNLITINTLPSNDQQYGLFYVDTLNALTTLICPISTAPAGDVTIYNGDFYYDDLADTIHRVTLNPIHDYSLGTIGCSAGVPYGLSTNILDTVTCQPEIIACSIFSICQVSPLTGMATPLCPDIIPTGAGGISGAASVTDQNCHHYSAPENLDTLFNFPNVFSPNSAAPNNTFHIINQNSQATLLTMKIFDRWGELVFDSDRDGTLEWNGQYRGKPQLTGNYVYIAKVKTSSNGTILTASGNLALIW